MNKFSLTLAAAAMFLVPGLALAQDDGDQAPPHIITVTHFRPSPENRAKVMAFIDKVSVPQARVNPNVLRFNVVTHYWGSNSHDVAIITEYPNWAAIEADCEACDKWAEENLPKEGQDGFEELQEGGRAFRAMQHKDEILAAPARRAK